MRLLNFKVSNSLWHSLTFTSPLTRIHDSQITSKNVCLYQKVYYVILVWKVFKNSIVMNIKISFQIYFTSVEAPHRKGAYKIILPHCAGLWPIFVKILNVYFWNIYPYRKLYFTYFLSPKKGLTLSCSK